MKKTPHSVMIDPRVRSYLQPERIVWQTEGDATPQNSAVLLQPGSGQSTVWARPGCMLTHKDKPAALLLDFGHELHGGIQLIVGTSPDNRVMKIRVRFGESATEAMETPNNDHAMHDSVIDLAPMSATEFGNTAFRFVRLDTVEPGFSIELKEVRAISLQRDLPFIGSFECSDQRLNQIWQTGAHTVHLCLQDYVWDGAKRDRLVWLGDMHPETVVTSAVFGKQDVVERSLDLSRDETPLPKVINGISSYSLWWIIIHEHWYRLYGDLEYLKEQRKYLKGLLTLMAGFVDKEGNETLPGWRFLDWPTAENEPVLHAGLQALLAIAMDCGATLSLALKDTKTGALCTSTARRLKAAAPDAGKSKQVNALQVLAGMRDAAATNEAILAVDPFRGISTFYGYYVLQARAAAGDYQGALDLIRKYWGGMLDVGATTFWEHFELEWLDGSGRIDELTPPGKRDIHRDCGAYCFKGLRHSFCHGWAGGPTAWLSEHVLGIKPQGVGMKRVAVSPNLGDLKWARGTYPTPYGPIAVEHKRGKNGLITTRVKSPKGVEIILSK